MSLASRCRRQLSALREHLRWEGEACEARGREAREQVAATWNIRHGVSIAACGVTILATRLMSDFGQR